MALIGTSVHQSPFSPAGVADILTQPAGTFIVPQQSVALSVGAAGSGTLAYQWYQGAAGDVSQPIPGATAASYQTPSLVASTSYWVRVSNSLGAEDSRTAAITMQTPPVITSQPPGKQLDMGKSATTSATVAGNNISYQWYRGFGGDTSIPLAGATSATLTLPNDVPGVRYYWVKATNDLGTVNSIAMRSEVTPAPPVIIDQPLDVTDYVDGYGSLNVQAGGAYLSYQWFAGTTGDLSHPVATGSSYFYPPDGFPGTYRYWVRISNSLGSVDSRTATFSLVSPLPPVITRQPYDVTTYVGSGDSMSVSTDGSGLEYAWYAGESGDTSVLVSDSYSTFSPVTAVPGTYRYWVRVFNPSGFVDSAATTYTVKPLAAGMISKHPVNKNR